MDLNDSLDGLFGGKPAAPPMTAAAPRQETLKKAVERAEASYFEPCGKCAGSGQTRWGICFRCNGKRGKAFKTAPETRAKAKASHAVKAEAQRIEKHEWRAAHEAEIVWLYAAAERQFENAHKGRKVWNFPVELSEKLAQYGTLTEGQLGAVRKCMANDAARAAEKAASQPAAVGIDASKIESAFAHARDYAHKDNGDNVRWLKVQLGDLVFLDMPAKGQWKAAIRVTSGEAKLGRIEAGKFSPSKDCTPEQTKTIVDIAADPAGAAKAHGLRFKYCACCGAELTNKESRDRGIGPICAEKFGW